MSSRLSPYWILLLAFAIRVAVAVGMPSEPTSDAADYHRLAVGLAAGNGYVDVSGRPTADRPPGYPAFVALVYRAVGVNPTAVYVAEALLGVGTVWLVYVIGALLLGPSRARMAALIAAVYPGLFWLPRLMLAENLAIPLQLSALCVAALLLRKPRMLLASALGGLLGVGMLVRASGLIFSGVLLLCVTFALCRADRTWRAVVPVGVCVVGLVLTLVPWTVRNHAVFDRFVPLATQQGIGLYSSYWPSQTSAKRIWGTLASADDPAIVALPESRNEAHRSAQLQALTLQKLRAQPGYFLAVLPEKILYLLSPFDWETFPHAPGQTRSLNIGYLLVLIPALFGLVVLYRKPVPDQWLLWVIPVSVLVQAIVFYGSPRFRIPAEVTAILLASAGLDRAWHSRRRWLPGGDLRGTDRSATEDGAPLEG
jgi:4-amino-4-deoxy-L-arabinose transferase-like glycosyltransferase